MNEVLQTQLAEVVEIAKNGAIQAVEILKVQMPELCSQILAYNFWMSLLFMVGLIISIIVFSIILHEGVKTGEKDEWYKPVPLIQSIISGVFLMGLVIVFLAEFNWDFIKIALAPKLYLIEYVSALIK